MKLKRLLITLGLATITVATATTLSKLNVKAQDDNDTYIKEEYLEYVYDISYEYGVFPELIMAIIESESSGNPKAMNGKCVGLMQVNTDVHQERMEELGVTDIYHPYENILTGVDILMEYAERYGEVSLALGHYHGERDVEERALRGEMSDYVIRILSRTAELSDLHYGL